jgi:peptide/nickel transport system ATP-binding protein
MLLAVNELTVSYELNGKKIGALEDVSLEIDQGETVAVVGESGSGKSTLALSILRLLPNNARVESGKVFYKGTNILELPTEKLRQMRGKEIAMVFQDPMSYFNPVLKVGEQIADAAVAHGITSENAVKSLVIQKLREVKIPDPEKVFDSYPFELSGGMAQRAMIASATILYPSLLIADEPTSSLDLTVQAQILNLLKSMKKETEMSLLLISHDIGVVSGMADSVVVMYLGRVMEKSAVSKIFRRPNHPYTQMLIRSGTGTDGPNSGGKLRTLNVLESRGCKFASRCPYAFGRCVEQPTGFVTSEGEIVFCWLYDK